MAKTGLQARSIHKTVKVGPYVPKPLKEGLSAKGGGHLSEIMTAGGLLALAVDADLRDTACELAYTRSVPVAVAEIRKLLRKRMVSQEIEEWVATLSPAERGRVLADLEAGRMPQKKKGG